MTVKWLAGMLNPDVKMAFMRDGELVHVEKAGEIGGSTFGECKVDTFEMSSYKLACLVELGEIA